jgi:hypothetical protein
MILPGIECIAPFRIYLPERFYEVKVENSTSLVKPIPLPPIGVNEGPQVHGRNIEISHDIFGYAGRTRFTVILDYAIDINSENWKHDFADKESVFINLAVMSINRMLEVYRDRDRNNLNEKSFHVVPLVQTDLSDFRLFAVDKCFNEVEGFVIRKPSFHRVGFGSAVERKQEIIDEIQILLQDGTPIPIYRELFSSALNYIWRGMYRLVPVEANTAFEGFVPEIIHLLDPTANRSQLPSIYEKLLKLEDVLSLALVQVREGIITWFTKPRNGWKTLYQQELKTWYNDCYCLRNRVIHEGYNKVSREEAIRSYEGAVAVVNYIQSEVRKIIKA